MNILVAKNEDEPLMFDGIPEFLQWLGRRVEKLSDVTHFICGGVMEDGEGNRYALMDL